MKQSPFFWWRNSIFGWHFATHCALSIIYRKFHLTLVTGVPDGVMVEVDVNDSNVIGELSDSGDRNRFAGKIVHLDQRSKMLGFLMKKDSTEKFNSNV